MNKFLFDCLTTFNTVWLFSRNIVVFVHNILFSAGSIFYSYLMWIWSLYLSFSFQYLIKILSHRNYFLAEGESWILLICVTAILFSLFRLLCILPVSKVIPFFGLRNFLSLFILDWRLNSCAQISLFFFLASYIRYSVGPSVGLSVGPSHFTFFVFLWSLASRLLPKWWSDLKYGPCPPARDWGSRASGLVHISSMS